MSIFKITQTQNQKKKTYKKFLNDDVETSNGDMEASTGDEDHNDDGDASYE